MSAPRAKATTRLLKARSELREWLADLAMLRGHSDSLDAGNAKRKAFNDAWNAAAAEASKAAAEYADAVAEAVREGRNGGQT